jgi:hypothetical protein
MKSGNVYVSYFDLYLMMMVMMMMMMTTTMMGSQDID